MPTSNLMTDPELRKSIEDIVMREVGPLWMDEQRYVEPLFMLFNEVLAERVREQRKVIAALRSALISGEPYSGRLKDETEAALDTAAAATPDETE